MGYQVTSKVMVGMGREPATERMTDEVWEEILRRTDIVRLASERGLDWPEELALGRREEAEIPQPLADTLADALEDMFVTQDVPDYVEDAGSLDQFTARRLIDILRAGGVILARISSPLVGDDAPPVA
jgi:hypothetical protein